MPVHDRVSLSVGNLSGCADPSRQAAFRHGYAVRNRPEIAVLIFTRLHNLTLEKMSLEKGAQAYLIKQQTSADALDKTIQKAVTAVASAQGKKPRFVAHLDGKAPPYSGFAQSRGTSPQVYFRNSFGGL